MNMENITINYGLRAMNYEFASGLSFSDIESSGYFPDDVLVKFKDIEFEITLCIRLQRFCCLRSWSIYLSADADELLPKT